MPLNQYIKGFGIDCRTNELEFLEKKWYFKILNAIKSIYVKSYYRYSWSRE